ncbi:MAG: aldehyde dehydrogenase family protein [Planctomycetaceae bacterium]
MTTDTNLSSAEVVDAIVDHLPTPNPSPTRLSLETRVQLCRECIESVFDVAGEWAEVAAVAKGLPQTSDIRTEDLLSGPTVVVRQLQLTVQTLKTLQTPAAPELPGRPSRLANGQVSVPVFPTSGFFDSLTFMGLRGTVRMQQGVDEHSLHGDRLQCVREGAIDGVSAVLGAGNVSSIPATDSLNRILFEGRRVLLKLNPVNDYLAPVFERAFAPLIREKLLTLITGGAEVGSCLIHHDRVTDFHITGSAATHDAIVWGSNPAEAARRKRDNQPLLLKPVTSELGNVTPWIMVPGQYTTKQLHSQAQHLASSITNNASFNCLATKVILTWNQWSQREEFLKLLQYYLRQTPLRPAYYPGAAERFRRFSGHEISPDDNNCLPWMLLIDQSVDERPELFQEESFVCVCAETQLSGQSPAQFLQQATEFVNQRMTGTLCASVTVPNGFRRQHPDVMAQVLNDLRYGSVCVNQWAGLAYGLVSPPWGAYPGATLQNVESGLGNVHNTYLLDRIEKTILEGPLINFPKPVWFAAHRNSLNVASRLLKLYHQPSIWRLPPLFAAALRG